MSAFDWIGLLANVITVLTGLGVVTGGFLALKRYREGLRVRAAQVLLDMEREFREILPTYSRLELNSTYRSEVVPLLERLKSGRPLDPEAHDLLVRLDRCLRFFYLACVLNRDLDVEGGVLARAYYHYIGLLTDARRRPELAAYVARHYPRLNDWAGDHGHAPTDD